MCGICGIAQRHGHVDHGALERMAATLRHRGPDDDGFYVSPADRGAACGLGFRRLSIIDVDGGHQPIPNEDESAWVMCNGEIYNFRELRAWLEARGHKFRTACDTEVIVHLWEERGPKLVDDLNGMFALAVWDERKRSLFLARDRMGKKPLYYADLEETLLFASEPKALLEHPACPRDLDAAALSQYLAFEYVPAPASMFAGIRKLPAGHRLLWRDGRASVERYWSIEFDEAPERNEDEWAAELVDRLRESIRLRLVSDVPLGVFLSGGIDSSAVVALMAELVEPASIKTFSIGFEEASFDESAHARRVASFFGTDHHEEVLTERRMVELVEPVFAQLDEPLADASLVPTRLLSAFARQHVTVALGGDGGDELFAGYPTFQAHLAARWYRVPRVVHERLVLPAAARLPVSTANFSLDFKIKRFLRGITEPAEVRDQLWLGSFSPAEQRSLLLGEPDGDAFAPLAAGTQVRERDLVHRLVAQYLRLYLEGDILVKVDRASMAESLEVRAPFLDYTFVSFVNSMPSQLKLRRLTTKAILKQAMRDILPADILERPKKGFGIPVADWLKSELRDLMLTHLSPARVRAQGLFDPSVVEELVRSHLSGRRDNRKQLWTLLVFQLWHEQWLEQPRSRLAPAGAAR